VQEGRKVTSFSGFKGKGFRFDETEAQLADERKKLQKAALGLHDSDDEETAVDVRHWHVSVRLSFCTYISTIKRPVSALFSGQCLPCTIALLCCWLYWQLFRFCY